MKNVGGIITIFYSGKKRQRKKNYFRLCCLQIWGFEFSNMPQSVHTDEEREHSFSHSSRVWVSSSLQALLRKETSSYTFLWVQHPTRSIAVNDPLNSFQFLITQISNHKSQMLANLFVWLTETSWRWFCSTYGFFFLKINMANTWVQIADNQVLIWLRRAGLKHFEQNYATWIVCELDSIPYANIFFSLLHSSTQYQVNNFVVLLEHVTKLLIQPCREFAW